MTVELVTSRDVMAEITRHRLASFAIESQRYVCMNGEIAFIEPECFIPGDTASAMARDVLIERLKDREPDRDALLGAVNEANKKIYER